MEADASQSQRELAFDVKDSKEERGQQKISPRPNPAGREKLFLPSTVQMGAQIRAGMPKISLFFPECRSDPFPA